MQIVWVLGLAVFVVLLSVAMKALARLHRRAFNYHEFQMYRGRVPSWVVKVEQGVMYGVIIAVVVFASVNYPKIGGLPHASGGKQEDLHAAVFYVLTGAAFIAIPMGTLSAHLVSWILPPVRHAKVAARAGCQLSLASTIRGNLLVWAICIPAGLALITLAIAAPWAR